MTPKKLEEVPQTRSKKPPHICTHTRLISDDVTEEEREAGTVRCVECGSVVSDPHS